MNRKKLFSYDSDDDKPKKLFSYDDEEDDDKDDKPKKLFSYDSDDDDEEDDKPKKLFYDSDDEEDDKPIFYKDSNFTNNTNNDIILKDTDLSKYDLSSSNMRIKSFIELHKYLLDVKNKNLLCSMDMEWYVKKTSFASTTKSVDSEAFKVYTTNELLGGIGTKLLKDTLQHRKEIEYYNEFTDVVLSNKNPHFPLVSVSQECDLCEGVYIKLEKCLLVFSELADGSASSIFPPKLIKENKEDLLSMICQISLACLTLEIKGLVHGDLHLGNILYHEEEDELKNKEKYFHYVYQNKHIYVKHKGKLWVLWDFGLTTRNGEENPRDGEINVNTLSTDLMRLVHLISIRDNRFDKFYKNKNLKSLNVINFITDLSNLPFMKDMIIVSDNEDQEKNTIVPTYKLL